MIAPAAKKAGMAVPDDLEDYNVEKFPHWHVFMLMQLGASMPYPGVHFDNAKVIADLPLQKVKESTYFDLLEAGFQDGTPIP